MTTRRTSRQRSGRVRSWFRDATLGQWVRRAVLAVVGGTVLLLLLVLLAYSTVSLPAEPEQLRTTIIRDAKGGQLAELFKDQNRVAVPLDKVANVMEQAVISAEDRHFYEHSGIDPVGTIRALFHDLRRKGVQGGSTITQQLVKNTYLTSERTLSRKAKEAILAVKVERSLSKREILERYLNTIYFGRGAYGIEKAAENYFGVTAAELDLPQAALLAGLIRAPESADPRLHPEAAQTRREIVLNAMVRNKAITAAEAAAAKAAPLPTIDRPDPDRTLTGSTAYFAAMVRQWAVDAFGERIAFGGGLQIETTLDPAKQADAERAVTSVLDRPDDPDAALVSMDEDGAVLALIGGKDFQTSQVNLAVNDSTSRAPRPQAGSTFKPMVLAAALDDGIPITQRYPGPSRKTVDFDGFPPYPVVNYGGEAFGTIDLTDATAHSVNTVYAQLAAEVGIRNVAETAHDLGIETNFPVVPSTALGSANVTPYEMLRAYLTFANRGERIDPFFVTRVTDADGDVVYTDGRHETNAYPAKYADVVNQVLTQTIERGTGTAAGFGRPAAGKTGTTSGNTDAWFVGYTPKIGTAVWMGYKEDAKRGMTNVHGRAVTGGSFPAQIWQRFMKAATDGMDTGEFTAPDEDLLKARPKGTSEPTTTSSTNTTSSTVPDESTTTSEPDGESTTTTTSTPETTTTVPEPSTTTTTRVKGGPPTTTG